MKKKILIPFLCGFLILCIKAQSTSYVLLNTGYLNLNGNYFTVGVSLYQVQKNDNVLSFAINGNMAYFKNKFIVIPQGEIAYTFTGKNKQPYKDINASFFKLGIAITPYSLQPKLGISALNILDIYTGYSIEFNPHTYTTFKGLFFGCQFKIPIQVL